MAEARIVYGDRWGEIIDRASTNLIELRWFDSTAHMTKDDFEKSLSTFALHVGETHHPQVLVDATSFRMNPAFMDGAWRDANIIPRYNHAGVKRFAFHMPAQMPMAGGPPAPEGPAQFPTGYFGTREEALSWLSGA